MANRYPIKCVGFASTLDYADDLAIDRAIDGTGRARAFYVEPKQMWRIVHPYLTAHERAELWTFYKANRRLPIEFNPHGSGPAISAIITRPPVFRQVGKDVYSAELSLEQFP
jgi:hypothetical protein